MIMARNAEERKGSYPNTPEPDLKQWSVALRWYRYRPSGWYRSYTALALKLDLPFVGLEDVEAR